MKTDIDIQHNVQYELEWEPSVNAAHIGVAASDGVVTLSGHVATFGEKLAAERAAQNVHGVRAVANEIEVRLAGDHERTDEDIAIDCVNALKRHSSIPQGRIKPTVEHGRITLHGEVEWHYQRLAAAKAVRYLPGVVGVLNAIAIRPHASPSDIKDKIERAFTRSAQLDAHRVAVSVTGGKVSLSGTVRSWAEKDEAVRTAWAAQGVDHVDDRILVLP
jgi:osmotically-inducible protein OsmY